VALLSIHPEYARAIFAGAKRVEFRRRPIAVDIRRVLVYATKPISSLLGWFELDEIIAKPPSLLWREFGRMGSIERTSFDLYFTGAQVAYALKLGEAHEFREPVALADAGVAYPPQFAQYLPGEVMDRLAARFCGLALPGPPLRLTTA
jgi:predicted transcriptional regulator